VFGGFLRDSEFILPRASLGHVLREKLEFNNAIVDTQGGEIRKES
jgi:hypothetical protein